jgi:hypothetical protein
MSLSIRSFRWADSVVMCLVVVVVQMCLPIAVQAQFDESVTLQGDLPLVTFDDNDGTLQQYAVEANDLGFRFHDLTAGQFPVTLEPGAISNRIVVKANGNVAFGSNTASFPFHFTAAAAGTRAGQFSQAKASVFLGVENTTAASVSNQAGIDLIARSSTTSTPASRIVSSFHVITHATRASILKFQTYDNGALVTPLTIRGNRVGVGNSNPSTTFQVGSATCNGTTWTDGSSRTLKHDIAELTLDAAREAIRGLTPVTFAYNDDPTDPRAGFIAEDVPELVATPDRRGLSSLDIVAALTKVVQDQEHALSTQEETIATLQEELAAERSAMADVLRRLEALEAAK